MRTTLKILTIIIVIIFAAYTYIWFDMGSKMKQQMRDVSNFENLEKFTGNIDGFDPKYLKFLKNFINFNLGEMEVTGYPFNFVFTVEGFNVEPSATSLIAAQSFVPKEFSNLIGDLKISYPKSSTAYGILNRNATSTVDGTVNLLGLEFKSNKPTTITSEGCSGFIDLIKQHYFGVTSEECMLNGGISGMEYESNESSISYKGNTYLTTNNTDLDINGLFSSKDVEIEYEVENYKIYKEIFSDLLSLISTLEASPLAKNNKDLVPTSLKNILSLLEQRTDNSSNGTNINLDVDLELSERLDFDAKREPKLNTLEIEEISIANNDYSINLEGEAQVKKEAFEFKLAIKNIDNLFKSLESLKDYYVAVAEESGKNIDDDLTHYEFIKNKIMPSIRNLAEIDSNGNYVYNFTKLSNEDMPSINGLSIDKFFEVNER